MSKPLASAWYKLDWAKEHADTLARQLDEATNEYNHPVTFNRQSKPETTIKIPGKEVTRFIYTVATMPSITPSHMLLLGDALQGFRSSLDHLAWVLVKRRGRRLSAKDKRLVQFPMATSRIKFWASVSGKTLPGVPRKPFLTEVERFQPYRRSPIGGTMRALRDLSNTDKHRFILPAILPLTSGSGLHAEVVGPKSCQQIGRVNWHVFGLPPFPALKPGAKVAEIVVADTPNCEVHMDGTLRVVPVLRGTGRTVKDQLNIFSATCTEILSKFEAFL